MVKKPAKKINIKAKKEQKKPVEKTTTPTVWNPFEVFENMDRFFWDDPWRSSLWERRPTMGLWPDRWMDVDKKMSPLDLVDTGDSYKIIAEIPGVSKKDLDVNITPHGIQIRGEMKSESEQNDEGYIRHERKYSSICRNMAFPEEVNPNKAEASLKDGILEISVSKKSPEGTGRRITVK